MDKDEYFLAIDGQAHGPFTETQVFEMLRTNRIEPETLFATDGATAWLPVSVLCLKRAPARVSPKNHTTEDDRSAPPILAAVAPADSDTFGGAVIDPDMFKSKSMLWYGFYTYVRIPIGLMHLWSLVGPVSEQRSPLELLLTTALQISVLIGLARMKRWGLNLNWVLLGYELLSVAAKMTADISAKTPPNAPPYYALVIFLISVAVIGGTWTLCNATYFYKRRHLFR